MRLLVTGAGGLLGRAVVAEARSRGWETLGLHHHALDVTDGAAVREAIGRWAAEVAGTSGEREGRSGTAVGVRTRERLLAVNCAAFSNVDRAEAEAEEAMAVNRDGAGNLARAAAEAGVPLVHLSTDYVFDGKKETPYLPQDQPAPLNVYGISKLAGETAVRQAGGEHVVVRTSWLFGDTETGFLPFVVRGLREGEADDEPLRVVSDETSRPTWVEDLAPALLDLGEERFRSPSPPETGDGTAERPDLLHLANTGYCTRLELAETVREVLEELEGEVFPRPIVPVTSREFGAPARRPARSVLDLTLGERVLGRGLPHWRDALRRFLFAGKAQHGAE